MVDPIAFTNIIGDTLRQSNIDWKSAVLDEIPIKTTIYRGFPSYIPTQIPIVESLKPPFLSLLFPWIFSPSRSHRNHQSNHICSMIFPMDFPMIFCQ